MKRKGAITLVFFIDALGWECIKNRDFLKQENLHRYKLRTVLGYSCAAQPSILTGLSPAEHGHWAMYYKTDEDSSFSWLKHIDILPSFIKNRGRFRRQVYKMHRKKSGYTGYYNLYNIPYKYFPYFELSEPRDIYAPGGFDHCENIFDVMEKQGLRYRVWNWRYPIEQSFNELSFVLDSTENYDVLFLYTAYLDGFLHANRHSAIEIDKGVTKVETLVNGAIQRASDTFDDVTFIVFSDHGMNKVVRHVDLRASLQTLPFSEHTDYLPFYDSTMARFWFSNDEARDAIVEALNNREDGRILSIDELRDEGILFDDDRYGELVYLCDEGTLILPSFMGRYPLKGMHGYHPDTADAYASLFMNREPDIEPRHIKDIFTLLKTVITERQ